MLKILILAFAFVM